MAEGLCCQEQKGRNTGHVLGHFHLHGNHCPGFLHGSGRPQILPDVVASYGSSDAVVPALAVSILPPGLTGLALAGILSVMMSTADSYLLVSVQTFVHDLGKKFHAGNDGKA